MEFRLLGSLEILASGRLLQLSSPRQRILLTMLVLEANRVVPLERLVDALWDDEPPATAKNQVQTCISALRHHLADVGAGEPISTQAPGYLLRVPNGALDIANFRHLVSQGRAAADQQPEEAVRQLRAALDLWRGPSIGDQVMNGEKQNVIARSQLDDRSSNERAIL
jgi:DNA-binding SARP family transcriptional activator